MMEYCNEQWPPRFFFEPCSVNIFALLTLQQYKFSSVHNTKAYMESKDIGPLNFNLCMI